MTKKVDELALRTKGVLPVQTLRKLHELSIINSIDGYPIEEDQFQPNSIDLRLGKRAYRVRSSFLPEDETVQQKLDKLQQYEFSITDGAVLETNGVYIIPLLETLNLPGQHSAQHQTVETSDVDGNIQITADDYLTGKTNPKSSTGRLDVFTRVITDYSHRFEEIRPGYSGRMYLEVVPKSFPVKVQTGQSLNQLRVRHGHSVLSDQDILREHDSNPLLYKSDGSPLSTQELTVNNGLFLSVNLQNDNGNLVGYKARKHSDLIDLIKRNYYKIEDYWEPVYARHDDHLILEPEAFYIFASKERCRIPKQLAAEMVAYDTGSGELRTHYAGFFDSGFGDGPNNKGARAVLEVRSHDVPFLIEDGQTFCSMIFEPNAGEPEFTYGSNINSNYQGQGLKLSKHFNQ